MGPTVITVDAGSASSFDASTIDALARLALALRRQGMSLQVCNAPTEVRQLCAFMGLDEALGLEA